MKQLIIAISFVLLTSMLFAQPQQPIMNKFQIAVKQLPLTDAQKTQMRQIEMKYITTYQAPVGSAFNEETIRANMKAMEEKRKKERDEIRKILTPEQRVQLRKLLGAKKIN